MVTILLDRKNDVKDRSYFEAVDYFSFETCKVFKLSPVNIHCLVSPDEDGSNEKFPTRRSSIHSFG